MDTKNIVFTADNNYIQHLAVTLVSLLENNKDEKFKLFIFSSDITDANKEKIAQIIKPYNCEVEYIVFDRKIFEHIDAGRYSIATYYRLLMPKYLNVDKLLYLDVDMVINDSIKELYETDIENYYVAAVEDAWRDKAYRNRLGMSEDAKYFNAGVLVVNLKRWREENLFDVFIEYEKNSKIELESHDQDIFNAIFNGNWKRLPLKYNQYEKNPDLDKHNLLKIFTQEEITEAQEHPVIVHYIGGRKPWHYRNEHVQKALYWKYLKMTPFKDYKPTDKSLRNIISKNTPLVIRNPKRYFKSLLSKS
ncbi:glycosyltransferase family 8 protein [bacterium]|nr:glycosyltransferase family 8 protein [bacterium]MBU1882835.1 glycosyltransferase family 8 protein [bacterium]